MYRKFIHFVTTHQIKTETAKGCDGSRSEKLLDNNIKSLSTFYTTESVIVDNRV